MLNVLNKPRNLIIRVDYLTQSNCTTEDTFFWVARHIPEGPDLKPTLRSLEPLNERDEDEATMEDHADDVEEKQCGQLKHSLSEAIGSKNCTRRMRSPPISWAGVVRVLVAPGGLDAHKQRQEEQHAIPVARIGHGCFIDGQEQALRGETKWVTSFLVVMAEPNMMIWSLLVVHGR